MSGDGRRRLSAIMDSGSAECVAPESIAKSVPLMKTEASREGQTYHTADGGVVKKKGEKTVTMYSETGDQYRARYRSRVIDQVFTQTGGWMVGKRGSLGNTECTCFTHGYMTLNRKTCTMAR